LITMMMAGRQIETRHASQSQDWQEFLGLEQGESNVLSVTPENRPTIVLPGRLMDG